CHRLALELALLALAAYLAAVLVTTGLGTAVDDVPPAPAEAAAAVASHAPAPLADYALIAERDVCNPARGGGNGPSGPARPRRRGRQHERPHDAAPRRGRGARGPPRRLPPLPDPRRQPVREARAAERRRRRACERHAGRRPDGASRLPPASPHRAAGRARH